MYLSQRGVPYPCNPKLVPEVPGVYAIICKPLNHFYVGSTNNLHSRLRNHFNNLKNNWALGKEDSFYAVYLEHGIDAFEWRTLEEHPGEKHTGSGAGRKHSRVLLSREYQSIDALEQEGLTRVNVQQPLGSPYATDGRQARKATLREMASKSYCTEQSQKWLLTADKAYLP